MKAINLTFNAAVREIAWIIKCVIAAKKEKRIFRKKSNVVNLKPERIFAF